jgi:hypothetical protein
VKADFPKENPLGVAASVYTNPENAIAAPQECNQSGTKLVSSQIGKVS